MKRGIIVVHDGHDTVESQQQTLAPQTDENVSIKPMTSEDWYYQLEDAAQGLSEGDEVHLVALHYMGDSMTHIAHAVKTLADQGIGIIVGGENLQDSGLVAAVRALIAAENAAAHARLTQLQGIAKKRRNATPPKCILVSAELLEELKAKRESA